MPKEILKRGATSNIIRVFLQDSASTTGAGKTALTSASSGLIISTIVDLEATATTYTSAATNVETITTLGTFAAPTASKCRFREVDATNFPGVYEIHIADARFAVANSTQLLISIQCTGVAPVFVEYQLVAVDLMDTVRFGLTALPNTAVTTNGSLITSGTGTAQLSVASGLVTAGSISNGAITSATFGTGAITSTVLAADSINATVIANGAIDAATFATGAINAAAIAADALTSAKFQDGALIIGATTGTGVKISHGVNSITAGVIADAAIDAATFADSALIIGSAAAGGVKAYLSPNSITAGVIANGAIDAATFAAGAIDAAAIATDAIDADAIANSAITIRMSGDGTASEGRIVAGSIASDVWNALVASYATANTFGARLPRVTTGSASNECILNASNHIAANIHQVQAGAITASGFAADAIDANALAANAATEIAVATLNTDVSSYPSPTAGYAMYQGLIEAGLAKAFAEQMTQPLYQQSMADYLLGRNIAGGSSTGRLVKEALYALRNKSEIVGSTLNVYNATDGAIAWTATVASSASADPVTGIDPA